MTEEWRRKKYYDKRVLVSVPRILNPQFDDMLVCLTGAQVELLRNMMQYLHRRSTFVSEYDGQYYMAPSTAEWDQLQAIVADLEDTLMGCPDIVTQLQAIAANLACLCSASSSWTLGQTPMPQLIDGYLETDALVPEDSYGDDTAADSERCALAQLVYAQNWEFLTEILQPAGVGTIAILLPAAMTALATFIGTPILGIPVGTITTAISALIAIDVAGSVDDVQNTITAAKEELVCALSDGLTMDYRAAAAAAEAVINDLAGLTSIDKIFTRLMFSPWAIALAQKALDNATTWALLNVDPDFCDDCEPDPDLFVREWNFPPCPGIWAGGFPCSSYGGPGLNGSAVIATTPSFTLSHMPANLDVRVECDFFSKFGYGWTVGYVNIQYWDDPDWVTRWTCTCTTLEPVGTATFAFSEGDDSPRVGDLFRVRLGGQPGQGDTDPWPFNPVRVKLVLSTPEP